MSTVGGQRLQSRALEVQASRFILPSYHKHVTWEFWVPVLLNHNDWRATLAVAKLIS